MDPHDREMYGGDYASFFRDQGSVDRAEFYRAMRIGFVYPDTWEAEQSSCSRPDGQPLRFWWMKSDARARCTDPDPAVFEDAPREFDYGQHMGSLTQAEGEAASKRLAEMSRTRFGTIAAPSPRTTRGANGGLLSALPRALARCLALLLALLPACGPGQASDGGDSTDDVHRWDLWKRGPRLARRARGRAWVDQAGRIVG